MTGGGHKYAEPGPELPRSKNSLLFNNVWAGIINACKAMTRIYMRDWGGAIHYLGIAQGRLGSTINVIRSERDILNHLNKNMGLEPEPAPKVPPTSEDVLRVFAEFLDQWTKIEKDAIEELKKEIGG